MSKDESVERIKQTLEKYEGIIEIKNNPAIKLLTSCASLIPPIGVVITTAESILQNIVESNIVLHRKELIEQILSGNRVITSEILYNTEFLSNFSKTVEAVDRLANNNKIKYFANLLKNGYFLENMISADEFDEHLEIIKTLSFREIQILCLSNTIECNKEKYFDRESTNEDYPPDRYWKAFKLNVKESIGISEDEVYGYMKKLERTGLFKFFNGFSFGETESGELTPNFKKFIKKISECV